MKRFENSDWLVLNSLIYKIYTTRDFELMRSEFLEQLRLVLDFDSAQFRLANEEGAIWPRNTRKMIIAGDFCTEAKALCTGSRM